MATAPVADRPRPSQLLCFACFFLRPAAKLEGLIRWSLDKLLSLDPHAMNLHGFSSGAIMTHTLVHTSYPRVPLSRINEGPGPRDVGQRGVAA